MDMSGWMLRGKRVLASESRSARGEGPLVLFLRFLLSRHRNVGNEVTGTARGTHQRRRSFRLEAPAHVRVATPELVQNGLRLGLIPHLIEPLELCPREIRREQRLLACAQEAAGAGEQE